MAERRESIVLALAALAGDRTRSTVPAHDLDALVAAGLAPSTPNDAPAPPARFSLTNGGSAVGTVVAGAATVRRNRFVSIFTFTDATVWIVGTLLDPAAPADSFAGFAVDTATLAVPTGIGPGPPPFAEQPVPSGTVIDIPDGVTARLAMTPSPGTTPPGAVVDDGAPVVIHPPATAVVDLLDGSATLTGVGDTSVTLYGSDVTFSGGPTHVQIAAGECVVGLATAAGEIVCDEPASTVFVTAGRAVVTAGTWRLPVQRGSADDLGLAGSSNLGMTTGAGVSARWGSLDLPRSLTALTITAGAGRLTVTAPFTADRPAVDHVELWDGATIDHPRTAEFVVTSPTAGTVTSAQTTFLDVVTVSGCALTAHLDVPCLADGAAPDLDQLMAQFATGTSADGELVAILGDVTPALAEAESYVLDNAVLVTTGVTQLVLLATRLGGVVARAELFLSAPLVLLLPTLPDPYAALLPTSTQPQRSAVCEVDWTAPARPVVGFAIAPALSAQAAHQERPVPRATVSLDGSAVLYDVSGKADQFGVSVSDQALLTAQTSGQSLTVSGEASMLFALPQVAWEAVITDDPGRARALFHPFADDDGPALTMNVATQALRPLGPDAFIEQFLADYAAGSDMFAHFTLPFGLEVEVSTAPTDPPGPAARPTLVRESPEFGTQTGGAQLAIVGDPGAGQPILPGRTFTTTADAADATYASAVLDPTIASFWDMEFGDPAAGPTFVPLERVDLSGYGSSAFSDYLDDTPAVSVSEARFDIVVGRVSYALVQIRSVLCPWGVEVVNTTIFQRDGAGWIQRRNTGWQARSPGTFFFGAGPATERGAVNAVTGVRNIVDLHLPPVSAAGRQWAQVNFDADVNLVTTGTNVLRLTGGDIGGSRIAGSNVTGWIDLTVGALPALTDVVALMDVVRDAPGSLTAEVVAGGDQAGGTPGIAMTVTGIDVASTTNAGPRTLAVALRGLPHLPRDGAWSVARRTKPLTILRPVDPQTPVPLIRTSLEPDVWHLAEPADVLSLADPAVLYSFVQSTGTQQMVFEHPTINATPGTNPLTFQQQPVLADVAALLGSGGLLPDLSGLLNFGAFSGFVPSGDGLATTQTQTLTTTTTIPDTSLVTLGSISVVLSSRPDPASPGGAPIPSVITVVIDPAASPRWSITVTDVAFKLLVDGMSSSPDPLVAVTGDIAAADGRSPTVDNLDFTYGSSLNLVKDVLSGIQAVARFLPGAGVSGLDVGFTGTTLRVRDAVSLPQLPLGLGYLEGISLELGFDLDLAARTMNFAVGVGSDDNPFTWLASPLAGNGLLQLGAGAAGLGVRMQGGIGVGLGIDVAVASGSASVCLAAQLDTTTLPFGIMLLLTGSASVDVLDGLASASLTLTAGLGIAVHPGPIEDLLPPPRIEDFINQTTVTLSAEVAVAIHLTVGWFVHVDWAGSWGFSETVSGRALTSLLP